MNKILVIQTAFVGDAVLTLPMIQKLKDIFNDAEIHVLCIPSSAEIFSVSPYVNEVLIYDKKEKDKGFLSLVKLIYGLDLKSIQESIHLTDPSEPQ